MADRCCRSLHALYCMVVCIANGASLNDLLAIDLVFDLRFWAPQSI